MEQKICLPSEEIVLGFLDTVSLAAMKNVASRYNSIVEKCSRRLLLSGVSDTRAASIDAARDNGQCRESWTHRLHNFSCLKDCQSYCRCRRLLGCRCNSPDEFHVYRLRLDLSMSTIAELEVRTSSFVLAGHRFRVLLRHSGIAPLGLWLIEEPSVPERLGRPWSRIGFMVVSPYDLMKRDLFCVNHPYASYFSLPGIGMWDQPASIHGHLRHELVLPEHTEGKMLDLGFSTMTQEKSLASILDSMLYLNVDVVIQENMDEVRSNKRRRHQ